MTSPLLRIISLWNGPLEVSIFKSVFGYFRQWDYGALENLLKYGTISPPDYPLGAITAPVYLIYGKNDWLAAETDVKKLHKHLGNPQEMFLVEDHQFNHLDFMYGINALKHVYSRVVDIFTKH
nr:unnamed protein product [Callosobruchus analis]